MKYVRSSNLRAITAFVLLSLPASALARGHADAVVTPAAPAQAAGAAQLAIADQIDAMLEVRFSVLIDMPADDAASTAARRQGLSALSTFAATTVEGLISAAQDSETRVLMDERLRPILLRHQANIAAALADVGQSAMNRQDVVQARANQRFADGP